MMKRTLGIAALVALFALILSSAAGAAGGWVAAGSRTGGDAEATRQQLAAASNQLAANLDDNWKRYLALPPAVYTPNQAPNPQETQQAIQKYEDVARNPQYAALGARPEFQQTLTALRRYGEVRTASNAAIQLPPPPVR